jgi:hypothetical protein
MKTFTTEIITNYMGEHLKITMTDENGSVWDVPTDPANSDYQAYLAQLEEGDN